VRVVHERTGRSVDVTIDDRGPYVRGRIIDLSRRSAEVLGMVRAGLGDVRLERLPLRSWLPPDGAESPPQFSGKSLQQAAWFSARASLVDPLAVEAQLFR
jgi:rare lipoprotein A